MKQLATMHFRNGLMFAVIFSCMRQDKASELAAAKVLLQTMANFVCGLGKPSLHWMGEQRQRSAFARFIDYGRIGVVEREGENK